MDFEDEDESASAMTAAMGFSAFGASKPPAKKRKFNVATDAFVSGQELEKIDRGGAKGKGSGGNTMPLGRSRAIGQSKEGLEERAERLNGDLASGPPPPREQRRYGGGMNLPPPKATEENGEEADERPAYIDTSLEAPASISQELDLEKVAMQERIEALLASLQPAPPPGSDSIPFHSVMRPPPGLPSRPDMSGHWDGSMGSGHSSSRGGRGGGKGGGGRQRREHNEKWYEDYYDPSFNQNPWAKLEKERGLETLGTWVERRRGAGGEWEDFVVHLNTT